MQSDLDLLFSRGLEDLNLTVSAYAKANLLNFIFFLKKWNQRYNLTSICDMQKMVSHHLLDSLSIASFISGDSILDVGTGAGFPGIPLAMCFPEKSFTLLDSQGKKTRFLIQAKSEFAIENIEIIQQRSEQWRPPRLFDQILTRAVGSIKDIMKQTSHLLKPEGEWLFMKGDLQKEKLKEGSFASFIHPIKVPGINASRYLIITPKSSDPP